MSSDALAITGILVTVVLGGLAFLAAKNVWSNRQTQNVDRGGSGIQAGRDVHVERDQ